MLTKGSFFSQLSLLAFISLLALCLPLVTNLVKQSQDDRSRATESTSSQISFKVAFKGVKPSANCLTSLTKVKVEVANKPTNTYQSDITTTLTPITNETNTNGDQVFLISNLVLDSKFNNVNNFNYLRVKGPNHLASRMCLNNQTGKLDELTTCEINLKNTNTTQYNFSNYALLPGDINQDGMVNSADYSIIKNNFNSTTSTCNQTGDLNYDGTINSLDASLLKESLSQQEEGQILNPNTITKTPTKTNTVTPTKTNTATPTKTPTPIVDSNLYPPIVPNSYNKKGLSDTFKVWWVKKTNYDLVYVWAQQPYKQIHFYSSSDYGKKSDKIANIMNNALKKVINPAKVTMAWNAAPGSSYSYSSSGFILKEGKIIREDPEGKIASNNKHRYPFAAIDNQNNLNFYKDHKNLDANSRRALYESIKNSGALNSIEIMNDVLLKDGEVVTKRTDTNSFQGFCQVNKNNFIYASIKNRSTLSLKDLAGILKNLGCKNAYRIDGGGSTTLWFKPAKATSWTKLQGTGSRSGMWSIAYWTEL